MKKIAEENETVSYEFDMLIVDKEYYKPGEMFAYKVDTHRGYGYCTLNKNTGELIIHEDKTDPYFLKHRIYISLIWGKLLMIREANKPFPETTCFAS